MRSVMITGPGQVEIVETPTPSGGPRDIIVRPRACGLCGTDLHHIANGGVPPSEGRTVLGHEAAGEIVYVGSQVRGLTSGDHVVVNPMGDPSGIIGNGGPTGALSELLVIREATLGHSVRLIPPDLPFDVAALNEPMAVAKHAVNRSHPRRGGTAVIFGAGPIGLGAAIGYKAAGIAHVVVVDVIAKRLERALAVGADAVINSAEQDVRSTLFDLHGAATDAIGQPRPATDVYLDAAGVPAVIDTIMACVKHRATVSIPAVYDEPVPIDLGRILTTEVTIAMAMGYPTEIFEVTDDIIANADKYAAIIGERIGFDDVLDAIKLAQTPGAADKIVITWP